MVFIDMLLTVCKLTKDLHVYMTPTCTISRLDELMDTVSNMMTSQDPVEDVGVEVKVGDYCLAEYTSYDKR